MSLRQRLVSSSTATGGSASAPGQISMRNLRKLDIYRKVPKDLTEGSVLGGIVTALAVFLLVVLTIAEVRSLLRITEQTAILVDTSNNAQFRINLNLTVFGLSCEYLSVDLKNALGTIREDIETDTLHKFATDAHGTWKGSAVKKPAPPKLHNYDIPAGSLDHYGNERHAIEINTREEFETALAEHEVLLVDFHSPRCIHCVRFAPVYELAAVKLKGEIQEKTRKYGVRLATVDCLQHIDLCRENLIQAFPTVRVVRSSRPPVSSQTRSFLGFEFSTRSASANLYEVYRGPREVEPLVAFALRALREVMELKDKDGAAVEEIASEQADAGDSAVHTAGCRLEGFLDVARVPGSLVIRPHDADETHVFDLNLINCDHVIHHLSFGPLPLNQPYRNAGKLYKGLDHGSAHVHFVNIVSRRRVLLSGAPAAETYEFAMTSDSFEPKALLAAATGAQQAPPPPHIEIMFDLSPMQIVVSEHRTNLVEGITAMLALIGGVFSASYIIEAMLSALVGWIVRV